MADVWDNGPEDATLTGVLLVLANSADDNGGNCFPGNALIARRTRYSERTVIRAVVELERQGWITVLQRRGGRPKRGARKHELAEYHTQYMINVAKLKGSPDVTVPQPNSATAAKETGATQKACQGVTVSGEKRVTPAQTTVTLTPEKGDIDDKPPHPLNGVSVTDPSGNRSRVPAAAPQAKPVNPDAGEELMAAVWLFEELAIPSDFGTRAVAAEAIRMLAKSAGGIERAAQWILEAGQAARSGGETVNRFWFTDQRYMQADKVQNATGGSNGASRSSVTRERVSANKRAIAEALARRGLGGVGSVTGADGR